MELAAGYAPQNWYCYALDAKAPELFKRRINDLAHCFPNVFVAKRQFVVQRKGVNMDASFQECMRELLENDRKWKYVLLLQVSVYYFNWTGKFIFYLESRHTNSHKL